MANQRLFLACKSCDGSMLLGKRWLGEFWMYPDMDKTKELNDFFTAHAFGHCGDKGEGLDGFEVRYESDADWTVTP